MAEHTLHVLLRDNPGALHRAVTLFRRRGYNIHSLHVDRSETAGVSRMDVTFDAPSATQLAKELERFVDVISVRNVTRHPAPPFVSTSAPAFPTSLPTNRAQADGVCDEEDIAV